MGCIQAMPQKTIDTLKFSADARGSIPSPTMSSTRQDSMDSADSIIVSPVSIFSPRYQVTMSEMQDTFREAAVKNESQRSRESDGTSPKPRYRIDSNSITMALSDEADTHREQHRRQQTESLAGRTADTMEMSDDMQLRTAAKESIDYTNQHCTYYDYHDTEADDESDSVDVI